MTEDASEPTDVLALAEDADGDGAPATPMTPPHPPPGAGCRPGCSSRSASRSARCSASGAAAFVGDGDGGAPTMTLAPLDNPYPPDQAANAEQFLTAWERYRNATFVAELAYAAVLKKEIQGHLE